MRYTGDLTTPSPSEDPIEENDNLFDSFYNYAYNNTFSSDELAFIKTAKKLARIHSRLNLMDQEKGFEKFNKLDSDTKAALQWAYGPENEYMVQPENTFNQIRLSAGELISSPFRWAIDKAAGYGSFLGGIMSLGTQAMEGQTVDTPVELYRTFYDQENIYNEALEQKIKEKYGKEKAFIAKQLLKGLPPGEIIRTIKKLTPEYIDALASYANEQDVWQNGILEDYRQAKISFGRILGRSIAGERGKNSGVYGELVTSLGETFGFSDKEVNKWEQKYIGGKQQDKVFTVSSGYADLTATILFDPLTYFTGGGSAGWRFMGKAISTRAKINDIAKANDITKFFKQPEVIQFWDAYGAKIDELAKAREAKDYEKANSIITDIKTNFAKHTADEEITFALNNKFFNAAKVSEYAEAAGNLNKLMGGRVAGTSYYKNGIALAADIRKQRLGVRAIWNSFAKGEPTYVNVNVAVNELADELMGLGAEKAFRQPTPVLDKAAKDLKKFRNNFIRYVSLHPGDQAIEMGADAAKTIDTVKAIVRLIAPRDLADAFGERFLAATTAERYQMYAGLYRAIAFNLGIDKLDKGLQKIDELVNLKFGEANMRLGDNAIEPESFKGLKEFVDDVEGPIHGFQETPTVGNFDWNALMTYAANAAILNADQTVGLSKSYVGGLVGGIANNTVSSAIVKAWSFLTLIPKLGMRSGIDEITLFTLTAPREVVLMYYAGIAKSGAKTLTRATASKTSTGVLGNVLRKVFIRGPLKGKGFDPRNELDLTKRHEHLADAISWVQLNNLPEEATMSFFNQFMANDAVSYARLLNDTQKGWMADLIRFHPEMLESASSSLAKSIGGAAVDDAVRINYLPDTELTKFLDDYKIKVGKGFELVNPKNLKEEQIKWVMFDSFYRRFYLNKVFGLDVGGLFIRHNALETTADAENFIDDLVQHITASKGRTAKFLANKRGAELLSQKGLSNEQQVYKFARVIGKDLYEAFHGNMDSKSFNYDLLNFFKDPSNNMLTMQEIMAKVSYETYADLVGVNNLRRTPIATKIKPAGKNIVQWFNKFHDGVYDAMDRTVTSMFRQPATVAFYLHHRKLYLKQEEGFFDAILPEMIDRYNGTNIDPYEMAKLITNKKFSEEAMNAAINSILKFADNPHVRTNFVTAFRNVGRFARATEDFWRRMYRLAEVTPTAIYRMRLMHHGLNNVGTEAKDTEGNSYFIIPNDNVIFSALNPVFEELTGQGFVSPLPGNAYVVDFSAMNPSFQDQAGIPYLSGPIAGLSVIGLKALGNTYGGEPGAIFADKIDNLAFGEMGDNYTFKSMIPPSITRIVNLLNKDEMAEVNYSAILSSMSSMYAYGKGLPSNATPEEKQKFMDHLRIGAHNFIAARSIMSTILPFSLRSEEIGDMPDYIRNSGITNIRQEYFDILLAIIDKHGSDVADPFELATTIFTGKNPGKAIYTVSRSTKETKAIISQTDAMRDWVLSNKSFIKKYKGTNAAYFFAPQGGPTSVGAAKWLRATGIVENIDVYDYLQNLQTFEDKQKYFDISDWERKELSTAIDYESRRAISAAASNMRNMLKASNPLLTKALSPDGAFTVDDEILILKDLREIVNDKDSPITKDQRRRLKPIIELFDDKYEYITGLAVTYSPDPIRAKLGTRDKTIEELTKMAKGDPFLSQINRTILFPILKFHSRTSLSANVID